MLLLLGLAPAPAEAQVAGQYRAFWVDTFNTRLNSAADVMTIVERAKGAGANAVFVQVRRRGDAWYLRGREPRPEGASMDANFDPLAEVLAQAHAAGLEVHAFVVVGAIWNQNTLPSNPQHVFNTHGFTPAGPRSGADNWLTRTRLPDGASTSNGGYRFGSDYWLDFGHPDAATYTVDLLLDLVRNYPIDGLHLDRLQYPEIAGSTDGGASVGYNDVSLQRFREKYGRPAGSDPAADDPDWSNWRRDQITALMRRIYLNVIAIKPSVKISVGAIATGNAPGSDAGWPATDAYARVYQDWRKWTEEGVLDVAIPLLFRSEHTPADAEAFAAWTAWTRGHQYQRQAVIGIGSYLNSIEGTIKQIRATFEPGGSNPLDGVVLYSVGAHNAPVTRNPLAVPAGRDTPLRTFDDLSSGLRTGRTVAGQALEAGSANANASSLSGVFASPPVLPFSTSVTFAVGHVIGTVHGEDGRPLDSVDVVFESNVSAPRSVTTDGAGFFGGANLLSAEWRVSVSPAGESGRYLANCTLTISMGQVGRFDLQIDTSRPGVATCQTPQSSRASRLR
jgi:uncharacterized lipoprotein YddW (UPF0748 family)